MSFKKYEEMRDALGQFPLLGSARPAYFGLCFKTAWWYWFMQSFEQLGLPILEVFPRVFTALQGVGVLIVGLVALRWREEVEAGRADGAACMAMVLASLLVLPVWGASAYAARGAAALVCAGAGVAWCYARWFSCYCRMSNRDVLSSLFVSMALGSVLTVMLRALAVPVAAVVAAGLPLLAMGSVRKMGCYARTCPTGRGAVVPKNPSAAAKTLACVLAFSLFSCIVPAVLGSRVGGGSFGRFVIQEGVCAISSIVMLALTLLFKGEINLGTVWRGVLVWVGAVLAVVVFGPWPAIAEPVALGCMGTIKTALWAAVIAASRYVRMERLPFVCLGVAASWIAYATGSAAITLLGVETLSPSMAFASFFALTVVVMLCADPRDPSVRTVFGDQTIAVGEGGPSASGYESVCLELGRRHGLTPREIEIFSYLSRGRSKTYIAEALFISESTVKVHTKHLYAKLGVHNRQELISLLDGDGSAR